MSFASIQSQQFGNVQYYVVSGGVNATVNRTIFTHTQEGSFIYSLSLVLSIADTTFGTTTIKLGTDINTGDEKIINVMKNDVTGKDLHTYNRDLRAFY